MLALDIFRIQQLHGIMVYCIMVVITKLGPHPIVARPLILSGSCTGAPSCRYGRANDGDC